MIIKISKENISYCKGGVFMGEIVNYVLERELYVQETVVLKYKIQYPQLIKSRYRYGMRRFNEYNYEKAIELQRYCEEELFKEAKELYHYNMENDYPVMVYEIILDYEVTYQESSVVSLYTNEYMFLGGAHGNTKREAQNWNLQKGSPIILRELFPHNPYYLIDILKEINLQIAKQIEEEENQYFENYCQLVQENFRLENFYITSKGVVIFFNQYEIAPYSSGIPVFLMEL